MPSIGTAIFTHASDYEASFPIAKIGLVFTRGAEFKARLTSITLPSLQLLSVEEWLPRVAYIELKPKSVFIAFPSAKQGASFVWGGTTIQPGELAFHSRGDRIHQCTSGRSDWAAISLAPEHLAKFARVLIGTDFRMPPATRVVLRPPRRAAIVFQRLHESACRLARTRPDLVAQREVARAMEQEILHALVNCMEQVSTTTAGGGNALWQRRARIMRQFEDVLAQHPHCPMRTADVCKAIGVPANTLRACCLSSLGMAPSQYDRLKRLNLARAAFWRSDDSAVALPEFARRYGFYRSSRFSDLYRSVFGEPPRVKSKHAQ